MLVADYTKGVTGDPIRMSQMERDRIEERVASELAPVLLERLPRGEAELSALLESGQALAGRMGWDRVCEREFLGAVGGGS